MHPRTCKLTKREFIKLITSSDVVTSIRNSNSRTIEIDKNGNEKYHDKLIINPLNDDCNYIFESYGFVFKEINTDKITIKYSQFYRKNLKLTDEYTIAPLSIVNRLTFTTNKRYHSGLTVISNNGENLSYDQLKDLIFSLTRINDFSHVKWSDLI